MKNSPKKKRIKSHDLQKQTELSTPPEVLCLGLVFLSQKKHVMRIIFFLPGRRTSRKRKKKYIPQLPPVPLSHCPISGTEPHLHFCSCLPEDPASREAVSGAAFFLGTKATSSVCSYPLKNTTSGKMWLKSSPSTGSHNPKLKQNSIHMLEPAST